MKGILGCAVALTLGACGSSDGAVCDPPSGVWQWTLRETSGDCMLGTQTEDVGYDGTLTGFTSFRPECSGLRKLDTHTCELTVDYKCNRLDPKTNTAVVIHWVGSALVATAEITGSWTVEAEQGTSTCHSEVDVSARKR